MRKCQEADRSPETPETMSDKERHHLSEEAAENVKNELEQLIKHLDHIDANEDGEYHNDRADKDTQQRREPHKTADNKSNHRTPLILS